MKITVIIINIMLLVYLNLFSQEVLPQLPLSVNLDVSSFRYTPNSEKLEVSFAIYPNSVIMKYNGDTLCGSVVLNIKIIDAKNDSLVELSNLAFPLILKDSTAYRNAFIGKMNYQLSFGSYNLFVYSYDGNNRERKDSLYRKIVIDKYSGKPSISDIELCSKIMKTEDKSGYFYKNSYEVIPNPGLYYGDDISPVAFSYSEIYDLDPGSFYTITAGVEDKDGNMIKERKRVQKYPAKNIVDVNSVNINLIPSGKYRYVVILSDSSGNEITRSEKPVYLHNPKIKQGSPYYSVDLNMMNLTDKELADEFRKVQYISTAQDKKAFDKLPDIESRKKFMANFWKEVESGMKGKEGLTRSIYLDRIAFATNKFSIMGKAGWLTDRGRVYVFYERPDEIQSFPSSDNGKPYEIWNYYSIESGVLFIFVDRTGYGDYTLVHSTKRGELMDENWERFLK